MGKSENKNGNSILEKRQNSVPVQNMWKECEPGDTITRGLDS